MVAWGMSMSSRYLRLDPETVRLLDSCIAQAQHAAAQLHREGVDEVMRVRLASALMEAISLGERDEERLVAFALQVVPAYREKLAKQAPPLPETHAAARERAAPTPGR